MNKKGFLLGEEIVKIVLAVIGIIFLFVILFKVYYNYQADKDLEIAKATLERLKTEANSMPTGTTKDFEIYGPHSIGSINKLLLSWTNPNMPNTCLNLGWENCICICKKDTYSWKSQIKICDEWACIQSPLTILTPSEIEIQNIPLTIKITKTGNNLEITQA